MKKKQSLLGRITSKGVAAITKKMGKKSLDENAASVLKVADRFGMPVAQLRIQTIKAAEQDISECILAGKSDKEILQPAIDSPNYQALLKRCGLNNDHLQAIINEQRKKIGNNGNY